MPSLFSRKKGNARSTTRPASGVPENFGHRAGGMEQLRRTDSPEMPAARAGPPASQLPQAPQFAQKDAAYAANGAGRNAASTTQAERYGAQRNGTQPQSASLPDARQQQQAYQQQQQQQAYQQAAFQQQPAQQQFQQPMQQPMQQPAQQRASSSDGRPTSRGSSSSFWSKRVLRGSAAFPRRGFSAALHDQVLYWFGGKSEGGLSDELHVMDTATWEVRQVHAGGSVPEAREGHTATFIGRTMFVFGGELDARTCDSSLYAFNMANNTWYKVPMQGAALAGRKGHTTVPVGSKMFVFGGTADGRFLNDLVSFDVRAATKQGPRWNFDNLGTAGVAGSRNSQASLRREDLAQPPARAGHSCSVYPGSIYVFGGMNGEQSFNDLWVYDLELRRWTEVRPHGATPPARYGHASAVVDDCIFIMGGRTLRGEPLNDFFAYKISSQRWYTFQVNSAAWPHQVDPVFTLVKTRLLLYSGSMPRDDSAEQAVHSLDTSKIKIQPDAPRAAPVAAMPPPPASPVAQPGADDDSRARRHQSLMPPAPARVESPRAVSMVGGGDAAEPSRALSVEPGRALSAEPSRTLSVEPGRALAVDTHSASVDSFEMINAPEDGARANGARANGAWSPQASGPARRSIALVNSPPVGPAGAPPPAPAPADASGSAESVASGDDRRLTIQLRNRSSVAALAEAPAAEAARPLSDLPEPGVPGAQRGSAQLSISSEAKDALARVWGALEAQYAQQRGDADAPELPGDAARVLDVVLGMRRELRDAKQQLGAVSRVAMERVADAERGRTAALQEAIYLKAKASALAAASPQLLAKLGAHRIHELERLHANTLNDNDALRNQLAAANQALKQSHDVLAEHRADAELTRRQLRELEQLHADAQRAHDEDRQRLEAAAAAGEHGALASEALADLEAQLAAAEQLAADRDQALQALADADAARAQRLDHALAAAASAGARADRVQLMLEEALQRADALDARVAELEAAAERARGDTQRAQDRAARFEQLWAGAKDELAAAGDLRRAVAQLESKDQHIATLQRKLSDVHAVPRKDSGAGAQPFPRVSLSSDTSSAPDQRGREFHAAYLAAHRQWSDTRDELLSLKAVLRESDEARRESDARLATRERELGDVQARLSAFTSLLQEYADAQRPSKLKGLGEDEVSVAAMLAAIQQLQRSSSFAQQPEPAPCAEVAQPPVRIAQPNGPAHIL